jgi:serine/threonine protein phosphatase PrpC
VRRGAVTVANAGDSRCVLCRGGAAVDLSSDHKPDLPEELARIEEVGAQIPIYCPRVWLSDPPQTALTQSAADKSRLPEDVVCIEEAGCFCDPGLTLDQTHTGPSCP